MILLMSFMILRICFSHVFLSKRDYSLTSVNAGRSFRSSLSLCVFEYISTTIRTALRMTNINIY